MILLDSNVLVAALVETHPHHDTSVGCVDTARPNTTMAAAHSLAEVYSTLTRPNRPYRVTGADAARVIDQMTRRLSIVSMTAPQTRDAIRRFAGLGIGPGIYDYLIGTTAEFFGAGTIVTWNVRDFAGLFPALQVATPADLSPNGG